MREEIEGFDFACEWSNWNGWSCI